jgi:hypothetical protein
LILPFSSPPTTCRVTVEVFDPASTRVLQRPNIYKYSPYLTGNILRLHYKAQPVNAV